MIKKNLVLIGEKIKKTCDLFQRNILDVNLVAVSKTITSERIYEAIHCGCKIFGENYIQEAKEKWVKIKEEFPEIKLHFIGRLQTNKAREAVALFDCIETVDNKKLALELQKEVLKQNRNPEIFIQVNIGEESQKSGIAIDEVKGFIKFCRDDLLLNVVGLMAIPPQNQNPSPYFALMTKIARENSLLKLSMGMSSDYEDAIALGATHVRLGTAIFGDRVSPNVV